MASTKTIHGTKGNTYRVMWRNMLGAQKSRTFKQAAAAARYEAWRTLNPDLPDHDYDTPTPASVGMVGGDGPTVADMYARLVSVREVSRHREAAQDSLFARQLTALHNTPVTRLRPLDVRAWMKGLRMPDGKTPYAPATVGAALTLLRQILAAAIEDGYLTHNPAANIRPPQITGAVLTEADVLTPGELAAVIAAVPDQWRGLFAFLGYTGARLSEALGLTIEHLDMARGRVHLGIRVAEEVGGKIEIRDYGKTAAADRVISLPAPLLAILAQHIETYNPQPGRPLFGTARGTVPSRSVLRQRVWNPARDAAGIARPIPMRNLRHTHATHCLTVMKPLAVSVRLGHAKPTITLNTYARFIADPEADELARTALDAYFDASAALTEALR